MDSSEFENFSLNFDESLNKSEEILHTEGDYSPTNSDDILSDVNISQTTVFDNMKIFVSLSHLNEVIKKSLSKCVACDSNDLYFQPSSQSSINYKLSIKCRNCPKIASGWALPKSANFAFALHSISSGIKLSKLENLFQSMNFNLSFSSTVF